jgi:hypothetical protein
MFHFFSTQTSFIECHFVLYFVKLFRVEVLRVGVFQLNPKFGPPGHLIKLTSIQGHVHKKPTNGIAR